MSVRINKDNTLSNKQKKINHFLIWLVPFVWALFYHLVSSAKPEKGSYSYPNKQMYDNHPAGDNSAGPM